MPDQKGETIDRRAAIHGARESKVAWFQELANQDRYLATQTLLDPLGTLSKFGLIDPSDNDLHMQVTKGSLADLIYLRESVATRGLDNVLSTPETERAARIVVSISVSFTWDGVRVTITVTFAL